MSDFLVACHVYHGQEAIAETQGLKLVSPQAADKKSNPHYEMEDSGLPRQQNAELRISAAIGRTEQTHMSGLFCYVTNLRANLS